MSKRFGKIRQPGREIEPVAFLFSGHFSRTNTTPYVYPRIYNGAATGVWTEVTRLRGAVGSSTMTLRSSSIERAHPGPPLLSSCRDKNAVGEPTGRALRRGAARPIDCVKLTEFQYCNSSKKRVRGPVGGVGDYCFSVWTTPAAGNALYSPCPLLLAAPERGNEINSCHSAKLTGCRITLKLSMIK